MSLGIALCRLRLAGFRLRCPDASGSAFRKFGSRMVKVRAALGRSGAAIHRLHLQLWGCKVNPSPCANAKPGGIRLLEIRSYPLR